MGPHGLGLRVARFLAPIRRSTRDAGLKIAAVLGGGLRRSSSFLSFAKRLYSIVRDGLRWNER